MDYGKTTITVTETFNGKSRTLGKVTVEVPRTSIKDRDAGCEIIMHNSYTISDIIKLEFINWGATYSWKSADSSILMEKKGGYMVPMKEGTTTLTVYEKYKGVEKSIGTIKAVVKEPALSGIGFSSEALDDLGILYLDDDEDICVQFYIEYYPDIVNGKVIFSSSNEKVLKIVDKDYIELVGVGSVTITATCGIFTAKLQVVVKP